MALTLEEHNAKFFQYPVGTRLLVNPSGMRVFKGTVVLHPFATMYDNYVAVKKDDEPADAAPWLVATDDHYTTITVLEEGITPTHVMGLSPEVVDWAAHQAFLREIW